MGIATLRNKFLQGLHNQMNEQEEGDIAVTRDRSVSEAGRKQTEWIRLFFQQWAVKEGNPDSIKPSQLAKMCNGKKFNQLDMGVSEESLLLLMRWLDPDRNDEIDYDEFMGFLCPSQQNCAMPLPLRHNALRSAST